MNQLRLHMAVGSELDAPEAVVMSIEVVHENFVVASVSSKHDPWLLGVQASNRSDKGRAPAAYVPTLF
jgi:hypothetical protein